MFESFKYIRAPTFKHNENEVLENAYKSIAEIKGKFVVREPDIGYRVYNNYINFLSDLETMPESNRVFHEVIFNNCQKLKFDIDGPIDKLGHNPNEKYKNIINDVLSAIKLTFLVTFGSELEDHKIILCESALIDPIKKYSAHIILLYCVSDSQQARAFNEKVREFLKNDIKTFLDAGVNKTVQCFRLANCHKGDFRVKKIISNHSLRDTLISVTADCEMLPDIVDVAAINAKIVNLGPDNEKKILDFCESLGLLKDHEFKFSQNGTLFIFNRTGPGCCDLCEREHTHDSTLMISVVTDPVKMSLFKHCRKYNEENPAVKRSKFIGAINLEIAGPATAQNPQEAIKWTEKIIMRECDRPNETRELLFRKLPESMKNIYEDKNLRPFELAKTTIVHAMMKMGKTKELINYIDSHFADRLKESVIRFISFRQTFSGNIKEKFENFELYSDTRGKLTAPKLIIQVESLHRLEIRHGDEVPDLLILDECESIFEQFNSGLLKSHFKECFAKFQYLLAHSRHVICMDANISDRTYRILETMRPFSTDTALGTQGPQGAQSPQIPELIYHRNTYKNAGEDNYYVTADKIKWLNCLYTSIDADEKIAVPMSSLSEANALYGNIQKKYPNCRVKIYSSETSVSEKKIHFAKVNDYWRQYDVLIYTPTVSAGVSFEIAHYNKMFCYFTDESCPVETCLQMIGRIRNIADKSYFICISAKGNNLPETIDKIKEYIFCRRENLYKEFDQYGIELKYEATGEVVYHTGDYFQLWLENARIKNLSKNAFVRHFVQIIKSTGATVAHLTVEMHNEITGLESIEESSVREEHDDIKSSIRAEKIANIVAAADIDTDEARRIQDLINSQVDVPIESRLELERHKLCNDYNFEGVVDPLFVKTYNDYKVRRVYKNICRIYNEDFKIDLGAIRREEAEINRQLMNLGVSEEYRDINRKYVSDQHRYALGFLNMCGFADLYEDKYIHSTILSQNLTESKYWSIIAAACNEFEIRRPSRENISLKDSASAMICMLKPINAILTIMYGIEIVSKRADPLMYFLRTNKLFARTEAESKLKNKPLICK